MTWKPIQFCRLEAILVEDYARCPPDLQALFCDSAIPPEKWEQSPWGIQGGGFWAVAVKGDLVLWYNDIEDGFNVSRYVRLKEIPTEEYFCNQDSLEQALIILAGSSSIRLGPPELPANLDREV